MKIKNYFLIFMLIACCSCKKDFISSLSNNPNAPDIESATPELLLPNAISTIAGTVYGGGTYSNIYFWMGYWSKSQIAEFDFDAATYRLTDLNPQVWDSYYSAIANLQYLEKKASADPLMQRYVAISKILKSLIYQYLVDVYNDVPYTEAVSDRGNFFPKYDKGAAIYDSIVKNINLAISSIKDNLNNNLQKSVGQEDIMFRGDMNKWLKFANTIKLRMLLRQSEMPDRLTYIQSEIENTLDVGFVDGDDNALVNPGFLNSNDKQNPFYAAFGLSAGGALGNDFSYIRAGRFALDFYKNTEDPRIAFFYCKPGEDPSQQLFFQPQVPVNPDDYVADYLGEQTLNPSNGSGLGSGLIKSFSQSSVMMLASESLFLQAEATLRGWLPGGDDEAKALYHKAIASSFRYLGVKNGVSSADDLAATYYNQVNLTNVSWPASGFADKLETVLTQKWAALNSINMVEAFNDHRKTGFPKIALSVYPQNTQTHLPYRFYYPQSEASLNTNSWKAAGGNTIDPFSNKIFWMP
jgi:hypothetical protein